MPFYLHITSNSFHIHNLYQNSFLIAYTCDFYANSDSAVLTIGALLCKGLKLKTFVNLTLPNKPNITVAWRQMCCVYVMADRYSVFGVPAIWPSVNTF